MNPASLFYDTFATPLGEFSLATNATGAVVATAFGDVNALRARLGRPADFHLIGETGITRSAREQVREYFAGSRHVFDLPLALRGTEFQQRVWAALRTIPFGETRTYGELAAALGNAGASRAVGGANGANPICLIVPCHRVIGRDGSLTGFAFGEDLKRRLLAHERGNASAVRAA
jgi:methylated-DNA-[protein]-cysteine S-methyltransferase